jgi:hypothetical protein
MNQTQAWLMCIPATAIAITVLIWLQSIYNHLADQDTLRGMQEGHGQWTEMLRHRNRSPDAALSSEPITIEELRALLGCDSAAMRVRFDGEGGFSEPGQRN